MAKAKVNIVHPPIEFDTDGHVVPTLARPCEDLTVRRVNLNDTARQLEFFSRVFSPPVSEPVEDASEAA
jgi:hypothetical protein